MERMFLITALNRERVESRILQVLDHHMVPITSFSSMRLGEEARVTFSAKLDDDDARRTCDMLRRLHDVHFVDCFATQNGFCRTLVMFRILCDQELRLPMLQVISSMGAQVVAVRPNWIVFQSIGSPQDIEGLRASLLPYGLVDAISVALAAVPSHPGETVNPEFKSLATNASNIDSTSAAHPAMNAYEVSV